MHALAGTLGETIWLAGRLVFGLALQGETSG
jgi:hypothetical protein